MSKYTVNEDGVMVKRYDNTDPIDDDAMRADVGRILARAEAERERRRVEHGQTSLDFSGLKK